MNTVCKNGRESRPALYGRKRTLSAVLILAVSTAQIGWAKELFRYEDENGITVLSHSIPAERVPYGYDIVDEASRLIRRVAPQLTQAEYAAKVELEQAQAACETQFRRVKKAYQSTDDIDLAERMSLLGIETSITNAKANLSHVQAQRRDLESRAAQRDLEGLQISGELLTDIERAKTQETNLEEEIAGREVEKVEQKRQYDFDRQVYRLGNCDNGLPTTLSDVSSIAGSR